MSFQPRPYVSTGLLSDAVSVSAPVVGLVLPMAGPVSGGGEAVLYGGYFGASAGVVTIGGATATIVSWSDGVVSVIVPPGVVGSSDVAVFPATGGSVVKADAYQYTDEIDCAAGASSFYVGLARTATRLIQQFGADVTLQRRTGRTINPVTGVITPGVVDDQYTRGIVLNYPASLIDGSRIRDNDRLLVVNNSVRPIMSDVPAICDRPIGNIIIIRESSPAGLAMVYFVQVRS